MVYAEKEHRYLLDAKMRFCKVEYRLFFGTKDILCNEVWTLGMAAAMAANE